MRKETADRLRYIRNNLAAAFGENYPMRYKWDCRRMYVTRSLFEERDDLVINSEILNVLQAYLSKRNLYITTESRGMPYEDYDEAYIVVRYDELESDDEYAFRISEFYELVNLRLDPEYQEYLRLDNKFGGALHNV